MPEIHYALDAQGNYQVAPGDIEVAKEQGLDENFDPVHLNTMVTAALAKGLQLVVLTINLHKDVL